MLTRLAAIGAAMFVLMAASPGTVKIDTDNSLPDNEPHVCVLDVRDWMSDSADYTIRSWPPTGDGTVVLTGVTGNPETITLPNGHYKLESGHRQKVFWVECVVVPPPVVPPPVTPTAPVATISVEIIDRALPETDTTTDLLPAWIVGMFVLILGGSLVLGRKWR